MASSAGHTLTCGPSFSLGASAYASFGDASLGEMGEPGGAEMLTGGPDDLREWYRTYVEGLCDVD
jgi:hypothetical protein